MPGVPKWVLIILDSGRNTRPYYQAFLFDDSSFCQHHGRAHHYFELGWSCVFLFGEMGTNLAGASAGALVGSAFTAFMNLIELLVAFLQAFIFAILTASYIGSAVEEHEHHDHDHEAAPKPTKH